MNHVLPVGWVLAPLSELLFGIETGKSFKCDERPPQSDEVGVVKVSAVTWGTYQEAESKTCTDPQKINPALYIQPGDFLFSRANTIELVGACVIARKVSLHVMLSDKILRFKFAEDAMKPWILNLLRSDQGRLQIQSLASGNQDSMRNIGQERIGQILVPMPPAAEQTHIVEKLEELLSDLDAGVAELKAAQKKLGQYRQSLLKAAVEGSDSGKPYLKLTLGELVTSIGQGWSPRCEREPATDNEQWAVMKTTAIQPLAFDGAHNKALPADLKPRVNLELKSGDLLVTRAGPRNRVGITCLVRTTRPKLILCDKAYRIRCDEKRIDPSFLELVLNTPHIVQRIDEMKTGISDSGLNLTQDRFFTLEIPVPTIKEQQMIVERINTQVTSIQDQEKSIELSLKQSTAQRKNILKAAFSGQLVPQDPNDEPASVLLERIRAERAERDAIKKPRGCKVKDIA